MKCRGNNLLMRTVLLRALAFSAVAALTLYPALAPVVASEAKVRFLALGVGKSLIVDLPRDIKDVLVADPKIANAVVRSMPRASRSRPMTSRSSATSTVCAPR
jgi:pilus assembly protein CpaC